MIGSQCQHGDAWLAVALLHGMQDAGRVVHDAEGIHRGAEVVLLKTLTDAVGKTGADKEHFFKWLYSEIGLADDNWCTEFHEDAKLRNCREKAK